MTEESQEKGEIANSVEGTGGGGGGKENNENLEESTKERQGRSFFQRKERKSQKRRGSGSTAKARGVAREDRTCVDSQRKL